MKLLVHLAARGSTEARLRSAVEEEVRRLAGDGWTATGMIRVADDPFAALSPGMRGYDATLEVRAPEAGAMISRIAGLGERLEPLVHLDLSTALVGVEHVIVPCPPAPVRYQYLMRRRADLDHEAYLRHYLDVHAEFGRRTPGTLGYSQLHVDLRASRDAARAAGLGIWRIDSIAELRLASAGAFLEASSRWPAGAEAIRDEERFVDRGCSVMFCSEIVIRRGAS